MSDAAKPFAERFEALRAQRGPFCLNLDPTPQLLSDWGLKDDIWGLRSFCERVIDAADRKLSVIKPQSAYFERFGAAGLEVLSDTIDAIHSLGSLALLDVKRGDIGSTNAAYADGLMGPDSALGADALTLHAYLGFAALGPFLDRAAQLGCGLFPVVLSSNPEGRTLQDAKRSDGLTVAEGLAEEITAENEKRWPGATVGAVGAVVGVTAKDAEDIVARLPHSLLLAPGLGAQGGTFEDVARRFAGARERVLPCSGRGVLRTGPDVKALASAIAAHCDRTRVALSVD
ncbi:MAG: orotidine-5'-phosphate decarboxylase [Myxococcales bacterium]